MIAQRYDDIIVPVFILDRSLDFVGLSDGSYDRGFAILAHDGFLAALCQNASTLFLINNSRIGLTRLEVGLVSASDPVSQILAAILDARVSTDNPIRQAELEVFNRPIFPNQERIALSWVVGCRLASNQSILHGPQLGIAVPA